MADLCPATGDPHTWVLQPTRTGRAGQRCEDCGTTREVEP